MKAEKGDSSPLYSGIKKNKEVKMQRK